MLCVYTILVDFVLVCFTLPQPRFKYRRILEIFEEAGLKCNIHIHTYIYIYICMYIYNYMYIYIYVCVCMYVYVCVYIYIYIYTRACVYV